jgi:excisionase family DNA binding protein
MKNYISVAEYAKRFNLPNRQIYTMIENNQVEFTTSAGGKKYFIAVEQDSGISLEEVNLKLDMLLRHLGVQ